MRIDLRSGAFNRGVRGILCLLLGDRDVLEPGTPVGICVEPFEGMPGPRGWIIGGTDTRVIGGYTEVEGPRLIDDDAWHEVMVDLRAIRAVTPEVRYLRRFMFRCDWRADQGQEFRYDDFAILPE